MNRLRPELLLILVCGLIAIGGAGACSPEHYKAEADEDTYKIIDQKWRESFGTKANYVINDANTISRSNDVQFEAAPVAPESLSLAKAVAIATANSRNYQGQKESLYLSALTLTGVRHDYEQQWFATIDATYVKEGEGDSEFDMGGDISTRRQFIFSNGAQIGTSLVFSWARFLTGDPQTTLGSVLTATATAPLLGVNQGKLDWERLVQSERQVLYDIRTFNRFRQDFVVDTINAYYGVLQQKDSVTNAANNYKRVVESYDRLVMEAEAGRRTRIDVDEAAQNVLRAQDSSVRAQQGYERALDVFKVRLALPADANIILDQNELVALADLGVGEAEFSLDEAVETALSRRLELANVKDQIEDAAREVKLAAEGLGPQLEMSASAGYMSEPPRDFDHLVLDEGNYRLGFSGDLPLDRTFQRNAYRRAVIELLRSQREYEAEIDSVKLGVRDAFRLLQQTAEQYEIQKNSLALATQRVESNKLLLDAGRVTVRILLDSQDALVEAENALTAALVNHLDAKLRFYRDVGILQVRPDGMWDQGSIISRELKNGNGQEQQSGEANS